MAGCSVEVSKAGTISDYASILTGRDIATFCVKMEDATGYTLQVSDSDGTWFEPNMYLSPGTCQALRRLDKHDFRGAYAEGHAVLTIMHEATHITLNSSDEAIVECNAMLNIDKALKLFKLSPNRLKQLHNFAWEAHWSLPDEYLTDPVCRTHPLDVYYEIGPVKPIAKK